MNIISTTKNNNLEGLLAAFSMSGFGVAVWDSSKKVMLDMMYEVKPDILFYHEDNSAFEIARKKYPDCYFWDIRQKPIAGKTNVAQYFGGKKKKIYECDLGGFTDNFQPVNLKNKHDDKIRFWGNNKLDTPYYVGQIPIQERKHAIASCNKFLCFTEEECWNCLMNETIPTNYDNRQYKIDVWKNTYNHTATDILTKLNKPEASQCLQSLSLLLEKYKITT